MSKDYYLKGDQFIIEDYDRQKTFASFLPGIAGLNGIPMWAYYTNRGQGIAGFGIEDKDGAILDFVPANIAYRRTENSGFRTFVKKGKKVHEIFSSLSSQHVKRKMLIESNSLGFTEENYDLDLKVKVKYFTTSHQKFPALIRKLSLESISGKEYEIELIDGLMTLWPYGTNNETIKNMSNLAAAWFEVDNESNNLPFYKNRATSEDSAQVASLDAGHFYGAFVEGLDKPLDVFYDPYVIFGENTGGIRPWMFEKNSLESLLLMEQVSANKIPCAFSAYKGHLDQPLVINSICGKANSINMLNEIAKDFDSDFFIKQEVKAKELTESLVKDVYGRTAFPAFDAYVQQSYLDNLLRGGYPLVFKGKHEAIVYHVYSRIHGDMEREYNDFYVEPAYYSHGVGNFRDVNQNRRNDVYFVAEAGLFNIKQFMELIQLDGNNPLAIEGSVLTIDKNEIDPLIAMVETEKAMVHTLLMEPFTPGKLMTALDRNNVCLKVEKEEFLDQVMKFSRQEIKASYGQGYWVDHWTYNMDLIDNYLNIFPDRLEDLMFKGDYRYFLSPGKVLSREDKYVITDDGRVRQYDAVVIDEERLEKREISLGGTHWEVSQSGDLVTSTLYEKLYVLVLNKISNADPSGIGIMMNTDKPGWNDAMNGLPGLFGSGSSEVVELKRIVSLLESVALEEMKLPKEVADFAEAYTKVLKSYCKAEMDNLGLFEKAQALKESFDKSISYGLSGQNKSLSGESIMKGLQLMKLRLEEMTERAKVIGDGILPSYFIHEALEYDFIKGKRHPIKGMKNVRVKKWSSRALPFYLEAPARYMKQVGDKSIAKTMYDKIKLSSMYDQELGMYVTSESLDKESIEIGRARAFVPGWLERESVFMHMEYKYLLGMLKSGLYDEFFETMTRALPPFMDPKVYGRSILENSSFIASSRNPDPANHGRGFVSRLTGTTSELITMWLFMMTGMELFHVKDGELFFRLRPILPSQFFNEKGEVSFTLFGKTLVTYTNPLRLSTYGPKAAKVMEYLLVFKSGRSQLVKCISGKLAQAVRDGEISSIEVSLG